LTHWIVAYDVGNDGQRARLANALARRGVRRQLSVFECRLDDDALTALVDSARPLLEPGRDRLSAYAQCAACRARRRELGRRSGVLEAAYYVV
jgi:CRISPR-associated endonuclease Cas2